MDGQHQRGKESKKRKEYEVNDLGRQHDVREGGNDRRWKRTTTDEDKKGNRCPRKMIIECWRRAEARKAGRELSSMRISRS